MLVRAAVHKLSWSQISNQVWADMFYLLLRYIKPQNIYIFLRHKKKGKFNQTSLSFVCHRLKGYTQSDTMAQMTHDNLYIIPTELRKISLDGCENSCRYSQVLRFHLENFLRIPAELFSLYTWRIQKLKKKHEF